NETRFLNDETVVQVANTTREQVEAVARALGLTIVASEELGLLGRTIYRLKTGKLSVREAIRRLEANRIWAQPNYVFELTQLQSAPTTITEGDSAQYTITK